MDIRSAICNLITTVSNFIIESKLKAQLDLIQNLASKPNSNLDEILKLMNNLGKDQNIHQRVFSQPLQLNSPKPSNKVQAQSGANVSAFSGGINTKIQNNGSRIQYVSPVKTIRDDKQYKTNSDRQICLTSETLTQTPKNYNDFKPFDKLTIDLQSKQKDQSNLHINRPTLGVIQDLLEQSQKEISIPQNYNTQQILTQFNPNQQFDYQQDYQQYQQQVIKQYNQNKVSQRLLVNLDSCIKQMRSNTFKLILTNEKTTEIDTCTSIPQNSQLDNSITASQRKQFNPLQKGIHQKMTDKDLFYIQQNFLMKKLIVKAKKGEKSSPFNPVLDIFLQ
ncbi:unnamed protein product [Paramecium sonneborni]|uniref:Uncharacterized protein n=1 Tax=Paramecium sonneborni TaxID=65129 RepID=A0A8S1PL59_9CILI|nr:unnamed protein product [Paramecium sonneborni]